MRPNSSPTSPAPILRSRTLRSALAAATLWSAALAGVGALAQTPQAPRYQSPFTTAPAPAPLPTPTPITANGTVVEDVIARVNDQIINRSDLERSQQQLQAELQQQNAPPAEREQREKDLLRDMVDQQLLISRGKELGLNADAEVIRRLDEIRKQNNLPDLDALEKAARQQGVSFEDFKAQIRNQILTQEVVRDEVGRRLQMNQAQEQSFYDAHKSEFEQPEQVRLSEILIPTPADASEAAIAQAQKKADEVAAKVKSGTAFDALAKQYSGGPTAAQGGDLGLFKRGALAKVLEDQTFALPSGESTAPIRTRQGFVILKVTAHQQAGVPPLKEIEPQIQEAMYLQQLQPALRAYLTKLREDAYIDIKPGFVDTGSSAKQTKPVFTAYAPPVPKKKTPQQKARFDRGTRFSTANSAHPVTAPLAASIPAAATPPPATAESQVSSPTDSSQTSPTPSAAVTDTSTSAVAEAAPPPSSGKTRLIAKNDKPRKIKREKIRYGQAPRNSLPSGSADETVGTDRGPGTQSAALAALPANSTAPGTAFAPTGTTTEISATSDPDPLAPKAPVTGKTRFSAREPTIKAEKVQKKQTKVIEKAAATPAGPSPTEKASLQTQSAPLGLNGDTTKHPKKHRAKGAPKERLQDKKETPAETPVISPTVNPALGASPAGTTPSAPTADRTTLPPVTAPAPGAPPGGQPLPPTGDPSTTPNGTSAPPSI